MPAAVLPPAVSAFPPAVLDWLKARYMSDPKPDSWRTAEGSEIGRIVMIRFEDFADYLLNAGIDLQSTLGNLKTARLIDDTFVDVTATDNPADKLAPYAARMNLTIGRHRTVGILSAILNAKPATAPSQREVAPASKLALAIAVLMGHPDWSVKRVAKAAGCSPAYLSRRAEYQTARDCVKALGKDSLRIGKKPRGTRLGEYD